MRNLIVRLAFVAAAAFATANAEVVLTSDPSSLWTRDAITGVWSSPQVAAGESSVASFTTNNPCLITYQCKFTYSTSWTESEPYVYLDVGRSYDGGNQNQYLQTIYWTDEWVGKSHLLLDDDGVYDDNVISFTINNSEYVKEGVATAYLKDIKVRPVQCGHCQRGKYKRLLELWLLVQLSH